VDDAPDPKPSQKWTVVMWFVLLVAAAFGIPAFTMRDPGPIKTPYGERMAVADSLKTSADSAMGRHSP
jgi:hypothetical protein